MESRVPLRLFAALCAAFFIASSGMTRAASTQPSAVAVFAGGCFWGVEGLFEHVSGVREVVSGYAGGSAATAHSDMVESGKTRHAEAVRIVYDPSRVTYQQLLEIFFTVAHDPTQKDRQGPDEGPQYRSVVFTTSDDQRREALAEIDALEAAHVFPAKIVTEVTPLPAFYPAEPFHQHFMANHPNEPYIVANDKPKLELLRAKFPKLAT